MAGEDEETQEIAASREVVAVGQAAVEVDLTPTDGARAAPAGGARGKLLLQLADIRRPGKSGSYDVYVALPAGARPEDHPDHLAGRISLYGPPSRGDAPPRTFNFVLDISKLRDVIAAQLAYRARPLRVTIAPADDWSEPVTVGRIALHVG